LSLTRCILGNTLRSMKTMAMKRHSLHLDEQDMKALSKIAHRETTSTGIHVTAAGIVRRLIKQFLRGKAVRSKRPRVSVT
jgi:hypothetical protein